jgi:Sensors of blue-light using FAD
MDRSLLYVSRSRLALAEAEQAGKAIVAVARARNQALDVSGTLISTGPAFAQILEGSEDALAVLMSSIRADPRHTDVTILRYVAIAARRFRGWSMGYSGPASYVSRRVDPLLRDSQSAEANANVRQLIRLMNEFGRSDA